MQDDVGHVLDDPRQGRELVENALDLDGRDGRAFDRREQHPPQSVTDRGAKAALERLCIELTVRGRQRLGVDVEPLRLLKPFPQCHVSSVRAYRLPTSSTARRSTARRSAA